MSTFLGVLLLVGGFLAIFKLFSLTETARKTISASLEALVVLRDPEMDDDEKEAAMRAHAKRLFGCFLKLTLGAATALAVPGGALWGLDALGLLSFDKVVAVTISWEFLAATAIVAAIAWALAARKGKGNGSDFRYSLSERALHQVAFHSVTAQLSLADMEDSLYKERISVARNDRPVFVSGLPRGGTTLMLDMLHNLDEFASHRYRDMPFVLVPLLWNRFSRRFQIRDEMRERAHGDGMMVGVDSPEALEEMVWRPFWKRQYGKDRIRLWPKDRDAAFEDFFQAHMAKIIALKKEEGREASRYLSKNNLNISRIDYLLENHPGATVVVPYRHPVRQARSLLRQHRNFLDIHRQDSFARTYMEAVGHYDFGENLRPVDFGGWLDSRKHKDSTSINFWLEYWIAAYEHLLARAEERVHLHSHEAMCREPAKALGILADILEVNDREGFLANRERIWTGQAREASLDDIDQELFQKSEELWERMGRSSPFA